MASRGGLVKPAAKDRSLSRYDDRSLLRHDGSTEITTDRQRAGSISSPFVTEGDWTNVADKRIGTGKLILAGFVVISPFFGCGLLWAGFAPLSSAAIAPGVVSVASSRKTVQHLEGGIVREIHVQEGDSVAPDQILIQLDDTQARTTLGLLRSQYAAALAREARLSAEMKDDAAIIFPSQLLLESMASQAIEQILQGQRDI
ncbi:MAG: biotin/lipoyl-binding protein, partial [Geminicoccaceae bacterium]